MQQRRPNAAINQFIIFFKVFKKGFAALSFQKHCCYRLAHRGQLSIPRDPGLGRQLGAGLVCLPSTESFLQPAGGGVGRRKEVGRWKGWKEEGERPSSSRANICRAHTWAGPSSQQRPSVSSSTDNLLRPSHGIVSSLKIHLQYPKILRDSFIQQISICIYQALYIY